MTVEGLLREKHKPAKPDPESRFLLLANIGLLVLWLIWALDVYGSLPARIPLHFDAGGTPDRWGDKSILNWLGLYLAGLGLAIINLGCAFAIPVMIRKWPSAVNLPDKEKFLSLPQDAQKDFYPPLISMVFWIALSCTAVLWLMNYHIYQAAVSSEGGFSVVFAVVCVAIMIAAIIISIVFFLRRYNALMKKHAG